MRLYKIAQLHREGILKVMPLIKLMLQAGGKMFALAADSPYEFQGHYLCRNNFASETAVTFILQIFYLAVSHLEIDAHLTCCI